MGFVTPAAGGAVSWLEADSPRLRGAARSLAHRIGAHLLVVRVAFAVLTLAGGLGIAAYVAAWALFAGRDGSARRAPSTRNDVGVVFVVAATVSAATSLVGWLPAAMLWIVSLSMMGAAIAATSDGDHHNDAALRSAPIRAGVGVVLVVAAVTTALGTTQDLTRLWQGLIVVVALVAGLAMVVGPWLGRLSASAEHERLERIRAEERADIAMHLHDSVLQTLTLIQNRANEPQVVAALAHQQERELRRWLYGSELADPDAEVTFRSVVERLAAEIEDQYLVAVDSIVVGDTWLSPEATAVVGATREALVNAAKFSDSILVSVFAEVTDEEISVFVRDRGRGFEPQEIPPDRRGIAESIIGRVERVGGTASIRTHPGSGTEVVLSVRNPPADAPDRANQREIGEQ